MKCFAMQRYVVVKFYIDYLKMKKGYNSLGIFPVAHALRALSIK